MVNITKRNPSVWEKDKCRDFIDSSSICVEKQQKIHFSSYSVGGPSEFSTDYIYLPDQTSNWYFNPSYQWPGIGFLPKWGDYFDRGHGLVITYKYHAKVLSGIGKSITPAPGGWLPGQ